MHINRNLIKLLTNKKITREGLSQMFHTKSTRWKSYSILLNSCRQTTAFQPWRHLSVCLADTWNPDSEDSVFHARRRWKHLGSDLAYPEMFADDSIPVNLQRFHISYDRTLERISKSYLSVCKDEFVRPTVMFPSICSKGEGCIEAQLYYITFSK